MANENTIIGIGAVKADRMQFKGRLIRAFKRYCEVYGR